MVPPCNYSCHRQTSFVNSQQIVYERFLNCCPTPIMFGGTWLGLPWWVWLIIAILLLILLCLCIGWLLMCLLWKRKKVEKTKENNAWKTSSSTMIIPTKNNSMTMNKVDQQAQTIDNERCYRLNRENELNQQHTQNITNLEKTTHLGKEYQTTESINKNSNVFLENSNKNQKCFEANNSKFNENQNLNQKCYEANTSKFIENQNLNQQSSDSVDLKYAVDPNKMQFDYHESIPLRDKHPDYESNMSRKNAAFNATNNEMLRQRPPPPIYSSTTNSSNNYDGRYEEYDEFHKSIIDTTTLYENYPSNTRESRPRTNFHHHQQQHHPIYRSNPEQQYRLQQELEQRFDRQPRSRSHDVKSFNTRINDDNTLTQHHYPSDNEETYREETIRTVRQY